MTQGQARQLLVAFEVQERRMHAVRLRLVAESVAHDRPVAADQHVPGEQRDPDAAASTRRPRATVDTAAWMRSALKVSGGRAKAEVHAAALLDPVTGELRELWAALAAGETSAEHVRVGCKVMNRIPQHLRTRRRQELSVALTGHATTWAPEGSDLLARHLLAVLDPDASDRYDPAALQRRGFSMATDSTGMLITHGQHDPASGAYLKAAVDLLASYDRHHLPTPDSTDGADGAAGDGDAVGGDAVGGEPEQAGLVVSDPRVPTQRRHDALHQLVRAGIEHLAGCDTGRIGAAMSRLIISTTVDQLAAITGLTTATTDHLEATGHTMLDTTTPGSATCVGQGPISPGFLQLAACDAVTDRVLLDTTGAVISMTSGSRYATPAITRALIARDGGCAVPGCTAPPTLCDAHHAIWWSRGGPTSTDNLVLVCGRHHRDIHAQTWDVQMRDGIPWFRPSYHLHPDQPWTHATFTGATHRTRQLAQHLAAHERLHPHGRSWQPPDADDDTG